MTKIHVRGTIPAPVAEVWALAGDFGGISGWLPALANSGLRHGGTGDQVGDIRHCEVDGGPSYDETQTAQSDADHTYTFAIYESPLPMKNYQSTIKLSAKRDRTVMEWSGTFYPDPGKEEEITGLVEGIYQAGIKSLNQRFGG